MIPSEVAMKFSGASATCGNGKCPYTSQCRGTIETCLMKDVAAMIRGMMAEIATLQARIEHMEAVTEEDKNYIQALEKVNDQYKRTIYAYNRSMPNTKSVRKESKKPRRRKDPKEMDGDERYAYVEPKKKVEPPVVFI